MQNASAPPSDLPSVVIIEVPPEQHEQNGTENIEVPPQNEQNGTNGTEGTDGKENNEILSSYEDPGRVPPPFPNDNHHIEDVGSE